MRDRYLPATCISSAPHPHRDVLLHYFGCLGLDRRQEFYDSLNAHNQLRIRNELRHIRELRTIFEARYGNLVQPLMASMSLLRQSRRYRTLNHHGSVEDPVESSLEALTAANRYGLSANMILFEDSKKYTDTDYPYEFPNQKIPIEELLYNKDASTNPLMKPCPENRIRYFHLPANNMSWVEEAIARHYNEEVPEYESIFRRPEHPSKTYMILRPEFWRGQQRSGRKDAVHARHMRPRCDIISTNPDSIEELPKNLVLFMPYLHWETDSRRCKIDEIIRNLTEERKAKEYKETQNMRANQVLPLPALEKISWWSVGKREDDMRRAKRPMTSEAVPENFKSLHTLEDVVEAKVKETRNSSLRNRRCFGVMKPCTVLGQVLFRAAVVYEAMNSYFDQEILRDYLYETPPLHPRRTLAQSFYWTEKTTKRRDRDQVVYRGTAVQKEFVHHHNCGANRKEDCDQGRNHCDWTAGDRCNQCQHDIRKVARVVMVDQLWLWILDANTIITSFPKRWGRNHPDPSAVHESLRLRLQVAPKDEIRSVFDLALVIIDQCSRVFYDRTKTADRQPRVMDLFANAIGDITSQQMIAHERSLHYTQQASEIYKATRAAEASGTAKAFLDINRESKLVREINVIVDELQNIIYINKIQDRVLASFIKNANYISEGLRKGSYGEGKAEADAKQTHLWRQQFAHTIEMGLKDHLDDLSNLKEGADNVGNALRDLLDLNQQQANAVLAYEAVRQGKETLRQGRSIMLFTVVTIIFLPLSFFTGVYGMNNIEFNNSNYGLYEQLSYMLPISAGIIVISLLLAFSSSIRSCLMAIQACFSFIFAIVWTYLITFTGVYGAWSELKWDRESILESRDEYLVLMKMRARREKYARREMARVKEEMREKEAEVARSKVARTLRRNFPV